MKKIITLILGLCLCFALMGCGGSGSSSSSNIPVASDSAAYYKDGNLFVPINLAIKYNTYTVKSDKYTWYVRYSIGIVINHPFDMKEVTVECKNNIVTIPEKYANENYFLKTRCNNVATFILVTQKPNSGYIPEPEPDYPIIIR